MSTKKEIWRLLEPGVDVWQEGDEYFSNAGAIWEASPSHVWGLLVQPDSNLVRRRMTLPEPQVWISVQERMPTKEDGDAKGCILWARSDGAVYREYWDTKMGPAPQYWMPIPPFPDKDPDEEAWEEWSKKNLMRNYSLGNTEANAALKDGFMAGRKSVTIEGGSHA